MGEYMQAITTNDLQKSLRREEVTRQIIQTVHGTLNLDECFQQLADGLGRYLEADRCFISRYDPGSRRLTPPSKEYRSSDEIDSILKSREALWEPLGNFAHQLCQQDEPINFEQAIDSLSADKQTAISQIEVKSGIAVSVHHEDQCLAIIFVHQVKSRREWSDFEWDIMEATAKQVAVAIHRADQYQANERYRLVLDGADAGYWDFDLRTLKGIINRQFYQLLGYEPGELEPTLNAFRERVHPDERKDFESKLESSRKRGKPFSMELRLQHKSGDYRWYLSQGKTLLDEEGEAWRMVGLLTDITERKTLEKALEQSNQDLERFALIASHDLQTPVRKATTFAQQLRTLLSAHLSPESLDLFQRLENSLQSMQALIADLLQLSRISKDRDTEPVDLSEIVGWVLSDLQEQIRQKHAEIEIGPLNTVTADRMQMHALLQNLVENALKFQRPDARPWVKISAPCEPGKCRIKVEDNGIGIAPENTDRIFETLERLHGKNNKFPGTGVGLAICKRIAERHGGHIRVESEPGKGSVFIVELPVSQPR